MSERETLLPCPFCGGAAEIDNSDTGPWEWVACRDCAASGPSANYNTNPGDALAAWNIRILPPGSDSSPAAPAHTTDAMERAGRALYGCKSARKSNALATQKRVAAAITSAVEQERQALMRDAQNIIYSFKNRRDWRLSDFITALDESVRSRSAEPPDTERHLSISEQGTTMKRALLRSSKPVPDTEGGE